MSQIPRGVSIMHYRGQHVRNIQKEFNPTKNHRAIKIELTLPQYQKLKKAIKSNLKNIEI